MTQQQRQNLILQAIRSVADGSAAQGVENSAAVEERRRAQELQAELGRGGAHRPGLLSEAESVAESYLRQVGRLAHGETLLDNMTVRVRGTDGRDVSVTVPRWETARYLQSQMGSVGGIIMGGRPLTGDESLYDLWLRNQLGSLTVSNGSQPRVQATVRNAGG